MKITKQANGTLLEFGNKLNNKVKILFVCSAVLAVITTCWLARLVRLTWDDSSGSTNILRAFLFSFLMIEFLIFWKYLKRVLRKESLYITKDTLTIINTTLGQKKEDTYNISG